MIELFNLRRADLSKDYILQIHFNNGYLNVFTYTSHWRWTFPVKCPSCLTRATSWDCTKGSFSRASTAVGWAVCAESLNDGLTGLSSRVLQFPYWPLPFEIELLQTGRFVYVCVCVWVQRWGWGVSIQTIRREVSPTYRNVHIWNIWSLSWFHCSWRRWEQWLYDN